MLSASLHVPIMCVSLVLVSYRYLILPYLISILSDVKPETVDQLLMYNMKGNWRRDPH